MCVARGRDGLKEAVALRVRHATGKMYRTRSSSTIKDTRSPFVREETINYHV